MEMSAEKSGLCAPPCLVFLAGKGEVVARRKGRNSGWNRTSSPPSLCPSFPLAAFPVRNSRQVQGDFRPPSCPGAAEMSALVKLGPLRNIQPESSLFEPIELKPERFLQRYSFFFNLLQTKGGILRLEFIFLPYSCGSKAFFS